MNSNPLSVMIVDDNDDLSVLLGAQLSIQDITIQRHTSNFEELLSPEPWKGVNVVVMDLWLSPDGFETEFKLAHEILEYLKTNWPQIRRIVYTAVPSDVFANNGVRNLADCVLLKPLQTALLIEALYG